MTTQITDSKVRQAASAALVAALERASTHAVKPAESAALMAAVRDWSESVRRDDLIELAKELKALALDLDTKTIATGEQIIARAKAAIRDVVSQTVRETMTEAFAAEDTKRRKSSARVR